MKIIQLAIVVFLSFTLSGNAQKNMTKSANKALSILLADYNETSSLKTMDTKEFIMYLSKQNLSTKGMKIKKVKQLIYMTRKKEKRTIYLIQSAEGMAFSGAISNFNNAVFEGNQETQGDDDSDGGDSDGGDGDGDGGDGDGGGDDDHDDGDRVCIVISKVCDCGVVCTISDTCDGSDQSFPDCCDYVNCDDDSIKGDLTTPLETLMG